MVNGERWTSLEFITYLALVVSLGIGTVRRVAHSRPLQTDSGRIEEMVSTAASTPTLQPTLPDPIPSPTPHIQVVGSASTIYLSQHGIQLRNRGDYACFYFELLPIESPQDVRITSVGLGHITLWQDPEKFEQQDTLFDCYEMSGGSVGHIELGSLVAPTTIVARIGPLVLHNIGSALEGKVVISARDISAVEIPVRVEKPPLAWYSSELVWFLRIFIPAIATAILTYIGARAIRDYEARKARTKALDEFLKGHAKLLDEVFSSYYPVLWSNTQNNDTLFAISLEEELKKRGVLDDLPWEESRRLRAALDRRNRQEIVNELRHLFPLWKTKIQQSKSE